MLCSSSMMSVVLTSAIPVSALVNDWMTGFPFFSLKLTSEILHSSKTNSDYLEQLLFSSFENELSVISTDYVEQ